MKTVNQSMRKKDAMQLGPASPSTWMMSSRRTA